MKIGIDISPIVYGTGVSVYTKNLVKSLAELSPEHELVLFGGSLRRRHDLKKFLREIKGKHTSKIFFLPPTLADILFNNLRLPIELFTGQLDVFHSSDWTQPKSKAFKVTTVHDLSPLTDKNTHKKIQRVHKKRLQLIKKEVDNIIAPSKTTADKLKKLGFSKEKIKVIPEAAGETFYKRTETDIQIVKNKYGLEGEYILAIGSGTRKNTPKIISAFKKLKKQKKVKHLVITGSASHNIRKGEGIVFTGYVSEEDLAALYSGTLATVYISQEEGFGLPIIESFACAAPVVTTNQGSMKEIAGNAAVLVDPKNTNSVVKGIQKAIKNKSKLSRLGLKKAKQYSWAKTAEQTLNVYKLAQS